MKSYQRFLLQCGICFLLPPALLTGCSLVGWGIGAMTDSNKKGGEEVAGLAGLRTCEYGAEITLFTREGRKIEGEFAGIRDLNRRDYDREYLAAVETLKVGNQLPYPADSIAFDYYNVPGKPVRGRFRGLNPGTLALWRSPNQFSLSGIRNLRGDSARTLDLDALRAAMETGSLPYLTRGVLVERGNDTLEVPISEILRIERDTGGNAALTGFLIGAAVDAVVVVLYFAALKQTEESCNRVLGSNCHRR